MLHSYKGFVITPCYFRGGWKVMQGCNEVLHSNLLVTQVRKLVDELSEGH